MKEPFVFKYRKTSNKPKSDNKIEPVKNLNSKTTSSKEEVKAISSSKTSTEELSAMDNEVRSQLVSYKENMNLSRTIDPIEGGKWQYKLYSLFKSVLNVNEQSEFNSKFNTILNFFNENKDNIFHYNYIFRFPHHFPGTDKEFSIFRNMVVLAIETCDPATRSSNIKSINLEKATENLTESEKQKLVNFYF